MLKKVAVLSSLEENGIVAVLRAESSDKALKIADALIKGGVKSIELTFTVPNADIAIKRLAEKYGHRSDVVIGAGTVVDAYSAHDAINAGAKFLVAPTFEPAIAELANLYQLPYIPGTLTVNEMKVALKAGSEVIKLFPSNVVGPGFVKEAKAPLPQLEIMPSGGVNLDNLADWYQAGCRIIGIGGSLMKGAATNDFEQIEKNAETFVKKYQQLREQYA